jgi:hypothetical protein
VKTNILQKISEKNMEAGHRGSLRNPSYSGGKDQEDHGLKHPSQIVHKTLSPKNPSQKGVGGVAQGVGPEFKPYYCTKKKKEHGKLSHQSYI